ncbi:iron(III) transport system permease protein [Haloplanus vescus]|uniref:Iron(III) transport system permease protein n=1 Tax=Haloplanus vescus TaxID=555874 RepID=A0A1H3Y8S7_9EURY|nr:iron ABC transporter permease [Haloplanus vescus]SEA07401.1 iron(III) transport system permease protein [Haloplanus vescus]
MERGDSGVWRLIDGLREALDSPTGDDSHPVVVAAAVLVAVAVVSPLLWIFLRAADVGLAEAWSILVAPSTIEVFVNSLALVASVTLVSVVLGVPLAVLTVLTDLPFRRFWTIVLSLPLVVPSYLGAFAFVSAFGPHGTLAELLSPLGITIPTIYGFEGATLVLALFVYPYVFLTTRASLVSFDARQLEAAQTLNHGFRSAFRRVVLPQIAPGMTAGALLVAFYALSDFGTPAIMHFDTFTRVIYVQYNNFGRGTASLLSIQLLGVTALVLLLESRLGGDGAGYGGGVAGSDTPVASLGWLTVPALAFCALVATLTLVVPVAIFGMWLLRSGPGYVGGGFAFEWAFAMNSVYVAAIAAVVTGLAALPIAYVSARSGSRVARLLERSTYVGYAVPGIVLALSLVFLGANYLPWLYQTLPLLVFAYVVRFLPQAVGATRSSVLQVDADLLGAARTLGESPSGAFRRVTLPLIAPGLVAGAALVFLTTMKELPATLILHPTGFTTLVTYIWRVQEAGYYGRAALPALVLVVVSALSMILLLRQEGTNA